MIIRRSALGSGHGSVSPANLKASVVTKTVLDKVKKAAANKARFTALQQAWDVDAEAWLYTAGGVAAHPLCDSLAKFLGIPVRAFDEKFFVVPTFDPQAQKFDRFRVGLGADFATAKAGVVPDLKSLDSQSNRRFTP